MKQKNAQWIKKSLLCCVTGLLFVSLFSCKDKDEPIKIFDLNVKLVYPAQYPPMAGIKVKLENTTTGTSLEAQTDANGITLFQVNAGTYNVSVSESRVVGFSNVIFNGTANNIIVSDNRSVDISLQEAKIHQLVIKEFYCGGCQRNDGSGAFSNDQYVILYNNSGEPATLLNGSLGFTLPLNANATNNDMVGGVLSFENQGWIGAGYAFWTFPQPVTIEPGKQIVVALKNAVDNTLTYSNSINFANPSYYCTYDMESQFIQESSYPPPAAIPSNHWLKAYVWGLGSAWPMSISSPG
ncbi:MAG: carboxypeptidase-like regulatory domain-containing protein, partial [Bacteroidetes bacterium]|nr:carboxypeptidase-like regulatory domain-containing protein [Bacteroidota bacterium]